MGNYSKLIGSIVGGLLGLGVSKGILPAELATPEIVAAITALFAAVATYLFPANKPSDGTTLRSPAWVGLLATIALLAGCATTPVERDSIKAQFENARTGFIIAQVAVNTYRTLPECQPDNPRVRLCSKAETADKLHVALALAEAALDTAERVLTGEFEGDRQAVVAAAAGEVAALVLLLASVTGA